MNEEERELFYEFVQAALKFAESALEAWFAKRYAYMVADIRNSLREVMSAVEVMLNVKRIDK